jgi:hypothetical protein
MGGARDSFPDLHDLQLEVHVIEGEGRVVACVLSTEARSGDVAARFR